MSRNSEHVKKWRKETKSRMVIAMGGKCACCYYDVCEDALDFHHIDPTKKDLAFGAIRSHPRAWTKIVEELRKCILLCCRCHREIHAGMRALPKFFPFFDEAWAKYKTPKVELLNECPQCGKLKPRQNIYCSNICSGKAHRRVDWDSIDLLQMKTTMTLVAIAEMLCVSDMAVRKRLKKLSDV